MQNKIKPHKIQKKNKKIQTNQPTRYFNSLFTTSHPTHKLKKKSRITHLDPQANNLLSKYL